VSGAAYSLALGDDPRRVYRAWHLARSLVVRARAEPAAVHVHCVPELDEGRRALFGARGYTLHELARSPHGVAGEIADRLDALHATGASHAVLLGEGAMATGDLRPLLRDDAIVATLGEADDAPGGFYAVPRGLCAPLAEALRRLEAPAASGEAPERGALRSAVRRAGLPWSPVPARAEHVLDGDAPPAPGGAAGEVALLRYGEASLNVIGVLEPRAPLAPAARAAVESAGALIAGNFENRIFWDMRYRYFAERGSGVGSRGEHAEYKRRLLREQGVESAASVLDVGCGDLEVVSPLAIARYVGLDASPASLELARRKRPDWEFRLGLDPDAEPAEMVLCFEVLIHQPAPRAYRELVGYLAAKTRRSLIVSGYDAGDDAIERNPMVFFHEPLETSLRATGRFASVERIGSHTGVVVYRCEAGGR
jgi:hypothetical protein